MFFVKDVFCLSFIVGLKEHNLGEVRLTIQRKLQLMYALSAQQLNNVHSPAFLCMSFFFRLLPLGVTAVVHLPPSHPVPSILLCHINLLNILLDHIHESSLSSSSFPPTWQLHIQHLSAPFLSFQPHIEITTHPFLSLCHLASQCSVYFTRPPDYPSCFFANPFECFPVPSHSKPSLIFSVHRVHLLSKLPPQLCFPSPPYLLSPYVPASS